MTNQMFEEETHMEGGPPLQDTCSAWRHLLAILCCAFSVGCDSLEVRTEVLEELETEDYKVFVEKVYEPTILGSTHMYIWKHHENKYWIDDWDMLCRMGLPKQNAELSLLGDDLLLVSPVSPGGVIVNPYVLVPIDDPPEPLILVGDYADWNKDLISVHETGHHVIEEYVSQKEPAYHLIHASLKVRRSSTRNLYILDVETVETKVCDDSTLQVDVVWNDDIEDSRLFLNLWRDPKENMGVRLDGHAGDASGNK